MIQTIEGELRISSEIIAERTGNQHKNVLELVRNNRADLEAFGEVAFETRAGYNNAKVTVAHLNEQQSTLVTTYMRNSEIVRAFKLELVKQFYEMRKALTAPARELSPQELMARAVLEANRQLKALEATVAEVMPKANAWDHIVNSAGSWSYNDAAKVLFEQGVAQVGEKRLARDLVTWGYLYRDHKGRPHVYQRYLEQGLFATKARVYTDQVSGETRESSAPQVRITGKGLDMLFRRYRANELEGVA
ncbi:phage antirepressor KilAC domain-containing protein [Gulosibacter molinativorax]|nr:phage regulatory protein/antirepressor Ant [Gulosibacter molinativorax]QUY63304.1 Phage antirepressor protein [Gulosibacter molinativorax]